MLHPLKTGFVVVDLEVELRALDGERAEIVLAVRVVVGIEGREGLNLLAGERPLRLRA
jgi:hypothetical protein